MARDGNGSGDRITFGSNATIDAFVSRSIAMWVERDSVAASVVMATKLTTTAWQWIFAGATDKVRFRQDWSTTAGVWEAGTTTFANTRYHCAITYNGASTSNDPVMYLNGASETVTETTGPPAGTLSADGTATLSIFDYNTPATGLIGRIQNFCYATGIWTAAQVNRAKWWGRPGGAQAVYFPFHTTKLTNEGTATAPGTATNTTVASFLQVPPCQRPGVSMMMGIGT